MNDITAKDIENGGDGTGERPTGDVMGETSPFLVLLVLSCLHGGGMPQAEN